MTTRTCPVHGCTERLGATLQGDPWLMCRKHWFRVPIAEQQKLWRAYRAWQRLERQRLRLQRATAEVPASLVDGIAVAISAYIDVRADCIRSAAGPDVQMELAQ